jgi:threonyl-tRNA synthetase
VQIGIVPVRQDHLAYATKTARQLKQLNCRVDLLKQDLHLRNRIKHYEMEKVPYLLIVGDKEAESESVSVRSRREGQLGTMRLEQFIGHLSDQIRQGEPQCLFD